VRLYDPLENELPDAGMLVMQDAETGEQLFVDTHDPAFRERFVQAGERREAELREAFAHAGVDTLELATDDDLVDAVLRFSQMRKQRSKMSTGGALPLHLAPPSSVRGPSIPQVLRQAQDARGPSIPQGERNFAGGRR